MDKKIIYGTLFLAIFLLCAAQAWSDDLLNKNGAANSIKIAVTINEDDHIMGKLEYSNYANRYPLQLVTFNPSGGVIFPELYFFEITETTILSRNVHRIKCCPVNEKNGGDKVFMGTIDFRDELNPVIKLVNEGGYTYISNITEKGKEAQKKYIPNIWLGN